MCTKLKELWELDGLRNEEQDEHDEREDPKRAEETGADLLDYA